MLSLSKGKAKALEKSHINKQAYSYHTRTFIKTMKILDNLVRNI